MATYPATTLKEAVDLLEENVNQFHDILEGDSNTTVTLASGTVPSVRKALADMAAYKEPLAWDNGNTETDHLQPRTYSGNNYVPLTVPAPMGLTPDSNWKLYNFTVTNVDKVSIDQDGADTEAIHVKHADTTINYTSIPSDSDATTCGFIDKISSTNGGLEIVGLGDVTGIGLQFTGAADSPFTGDTSSGVFAIKGATGAGPGFSALANGDNLVSFANNSTVVAVMKGNGDIKTQGGVFAVGEISGLSSDERLKENIKPLESPLEVVKALNGVTFNFNEKGQSYGLPSEDQLGLLAQDVEKVCPEAVMAFAFDPEYKNVKYDKLVAVLVEAIKELSQQVEELRNDNSK